jgi:CheY-like chemotaxis protein
LLVENESITPENVTLRFSVSDTGIGIPADKREAILLPFVQVDTSKKRKYGGAGLGLSVSSRLIDLMGGRLWFESELGKGSTFHFTAQFGRPAPSAGGPTEAAAAGAEARAEDRAANEARAALAKRGPLRILVAEDNPINQKLIVRLLQKEGHAVSVANNGEEALAAVARQEFDLVLMDVQMPVIDGFEATAEIRRQELESGRRQPIVALTAHAMRGDREKCLEAGMDGYVAKPIRQDELLIAMAAAVGAAASRELVHAAAPDRESSRQEGATSQDRERNDAR